MEKNKTGKYLKYAIGEIVLVVVGILIALSINNWNQNRINNQKLKSYLTEISWDLEIDSIVTSGQIERLKIRMKKTKSFLAIKDYNELSKDSLEKSLETFHIDPYFADGSHKKLENSGIIDFGLHDTLIAHLKWYYDYTVPNHKMVLAKANQAVTTEDHFWRYSQNLYEFTYDDEFTSYQSKDASKKQLIQLLQSPIPRNILKTEYRRNKIHIALLTDLNKEISQLMEMINEAIQD